jgi:hypothetical protein
VCISSNFGRIVPRILFDVVKRDLERMSILGGYKGGRRGVSGGRKGVSFSQGKFNAKRFAKFSKFVKEERDVIIWEC